MPRTIKIEGVVLKKKSLLNKDYLVTFFSKEEGKIKVFAKGVKKITSRRLSHLQTGNLIKAVINKKDDRYYLQETKLISGFSKIKDSQVKSQYLYYFIFILERLLAENQRDFSVNNLLKKFLIELSEDNNFEKIKLYQYINKLIQDLGYSKENKPSHELRLFIEELINEKLPSFVI